MDRLLNVLVVVVITTLLSLLSLVGYWLMEDRQPVTPMNYQNIPVEPRVVNPDDPDNRVIEVIATFEKHSDAPIDWSAIIQCDNGDRRTIQNDIFPGTPPAAFENTRFLYVIPTVRTPTDCHIEFSLRYRPNPLATRAVFWKTESFEVIGDN